MSKNKKYGKSSSVDNFDDYDSAFHKDSTPSKTIYKRCYETHPALKIGDYKIFGGSCINPVCIDADIYIGFDSSMQIKLPYPWQPAIKTQYVYFYIQDMHAPADAIEFILMIEWIDQQLKLGKKIHLGCIGGHGRTGTVMAALVTKMTGNLDSIAYVRKHYCNKAVESTAQIKFLHEHFNINNDTAHKGDYMWSSKNNTDTISPSWAANKTHSLFNKTIPSTPQYDRDRINAGVVKELHDIEPVRVKGWIWD